MTILNFDTANRSGLQVDLPKLLSHKLAVQGNSGGGKSWLVRTLLEGTHGAVQHLILDPEGEFKTLRELYDDYVILAATGGDLDITPETTGAPVRALVRAGANIVLDLSDFTLGERDAVCAAAIETLMGQPREDWRHLLVVVDEAHTLAPEGMGGGASLTALIDLATRGRKRGYGLVAVTQRIALLNKSLLAMCSNRVIGLTTLGTDMKRAAEELGFNTRERQALKTLAVGEFFAYVPALSQDVVRVTSGPVRSTHPEPGQLTPATPPASEALAKVICSLQEGTAEPVTDSGVPVQTGITEHEALRRVAAAVTAAKAPLQNRVSELESSLRHMAGEIVGLLNESAGSPSTVTKPAAGEPEPAPVEVVREVAMPVPELPGPQLRILQALADTAQLGVEALERNTTAVLSKQSPRSSAFAAHVAALNAAGLLHYPKEGCIALTGQGQKLVPVSGKPTTLADLHRRWQSYLRPYETNLLSPLLDVYPKALSRENISRVSGKSLTSSAFADALASLKSLGLVSYPAKGQVSATELLFPKQLRAA